MRKFRLVLLFALLWAVSSAAAFASCDPHNAAGVPFNCTPAAASPALTDIVLGGANSGVDSGQTLRWTWEQIFTNTPLIAPTITNGVMDGNFTGTAFGTGVGKILGPWINYNSSGFPGLAVTSGRLIIYQASPTDNDFATLQLERTTAFSSVTANVNSNLRATTTVGANDGTNEWALLGNCQTVGTNGGSCVGTTGHGFRNAGGTQAIWGGVSEAKDNTGLASGTSGAHGTVGHEADVEANLLDTATNTLSITGAGNRVGVQVVAGRAITADTTLTEVTTGTLYSVLTTAVYYDRLIGSNNDVMAQYGLDMRGVTAPTGSANPVNAVVMSSGQIIEFNGSNSFTAAPSRSLSFATTLNYKVTGTTQLSVGDTGTLTVGSGGGSISNTAGQLNLLSSTGFGLEIAATASAANGVLITPTATGVDPTIKPYGDASRNLSLLPAGTGSVVASVFKVTSNAVVGGVALQGAGTLNVQNGYYINSVAGIDCAAGVTAGTVTVAKGLVTHC